MSEVTDYPPGTPSWADLATGDADAAEAFYTALFGWTADDMGEEAGNYRILRKGESDVAALYPSGPDQGPPHWNTYVTVDSVDKVADRVEQADGGVLAEPFDVMGAGRMAVVQDPTGAVLALWEPRSHIGAGVVNEPGAMCWNELLTGDRERAAGFYGAVIGWASHTQQMGSMTYTEFQNGDSSVAGMREMQGVPPRWNVYFAVEDTDATVARAIDLGGALRQPPVDLPVGRVAVLEDPQGASFSVIQLASAA